MDVAKKLRQRAAEQRERGWEIMREGDPSLLEEAAESIEWLRRERDMLADRCAKTDTPF
jgi:hypothetical protein